MNRMAPTLTDFEIVISDSDHHSVDAVVLAVYYQLAEHNTVLRMHGPIGDPIFLRQCVWRVHNEALTFLVVSDLSSHFHRIVPVSQLRESETSDIIQCVNSSNNTSFQRQYAHRIYSNTHTQNWLNQLEKHTIQLSKFGSASNMQKFRWIHATIPRRLSLCS